MKVKELIKLIEADGWVQVRFAEVIGNTKSSKAGYCDGLWKPKCGYSTRNIESCVKTNWSKIVRGENNGIHGSY